MIRSMTGYGDAAQTLGDTHYAVELRSLNNRYFKANLRLPEELQGLEAELESHLRKRLWRGSITLTVKLALTGDAAALNINDAVLLKYLEHLETIQTRINGDGRSINIDLTALLAMPGVMENADQRDLVEQARPVVMQLVDHACEKLIAMRVAEGKALADDLLKRADEIRQRMTLVGERAPLVVEEYHQRLRNRIDDLIARAQLGVNEVDLIKEVGVFADRADIAEEISRMTGHLEQFDQVIASNDTQPIGRTLEFIAQEMLREANTMGSKSNDATINRAMVEVKSAIDRIKEQTQNVE